MKYKTMAELGVPIPASKAHVVRTLKNITVEQRAKAQSATGYNVFSFPADLLLVDYLSDSGSTSMTDLQWAAMFSGDSSYGRNKGYFTLLEAFRDVFERGDSPKKLINLILTGETDFNKLAELYLADIAGGFVNGGKYQLERPNTFIVPQGRCSEFLLFSTLSEILHKKNPRVQYYIPSNGHFDTTDANIRESGLHPVNLFSADLFEDFDYHQMATKNPFKGNMNIAELKEFITAKGKDSIPLIYLTITNNTAGGQPVSLANIKAVKQVADKYNIPFFLDACRFAENAYFIKQYEPEYHEWSIQKIVQECFKQVDGFTVSFKKDGLANMGGGLFFRDCGIFHTKYSSDGCDIGIKLKEKQILTFGNDSYGGMSGRDIMALAMGLYEVVKYSYLHERVSQVQYFASQLAENGLPVLLPAGGHAVYLNMNKFFADTPIKLEDFGGVGFTIELIKHYGIRGCELGPFAFEWDQRSPEEREGILNLVRFAVPRNAYGTQHIDYTVAALVEVYKNRRYIPKVIIKHGANLRLRHFQSILEPIYPQ